MAVKVLIPTPLRQFTGKQSSIECSAATVGEALGNLTSTFAELRKHLYTDEGKIRSFVNVYLNDEDIRFLEKETRQPRMATPSASCLRSPEAALVGERIRGESPWQFQPTHFHSRK